MKFARSMLLVALAATALSALAASASANRLSISGGRWRELFTSLEFSGGFGSVRCPVTLEGSLVGRTVNKVRGGHIGNITSATAGACSAGGMTMLRETLPWEVSYEAFTGRLPRILAVRRAYRRWRSRIREPVFGVECLFASTEREPVTAEETVEEGEAVTSVTLGGTIPCEGVSGTIAGTSSSYTEPETGLRVRIKLI